MTSTLLCCTCYNDDNNGLVLSQSPSLPLQSPGLFWDCPLSATYADRVTPSQLVTVLGDRPHQGKSPESSPQVLETKYHLCSGTVP